MTCCWYWKFAIIHDYKSSDIKLILGWNVQHPGNHAVLPHKICPWCTKSKYHTMDTARKRTWKRKTLPVDNVSLKTRRGLHFMIKLIGFRKTSLCLFDCQIFRIVNLRVIRLRNKSECIKKDYTLMHLHQTCVCVRDRFLTFEDTIKTSEF